MKKRIVSFLMALVMMTSLLPVQVFAADVDTPADVPAAVEARDVQPVEAQQDEEINTPVTQATESKVTVKYTVNETEQTASETVIGSYYRKIVTDEVRGPLFLISLPYGSTVTSVVADSGKQIYFSGAEKSRKKNLSDVTYLSNKDFIKPSSNSFYAKDYAGMTFNEGFSLASTDVTGFVISADQDIDAGKITVLIVQISTSSGETITDADKAPLKALIDSVAGETPQYYEPTDGSDKWNGRTYEANGHWNAFVASGILTKAQKVLESSGSKKALDEMYADLTAAIANLIPATQLNPTALYDALQLYSGVTSNSYSDEVLMGKTTATVNVFKAARSDAEEYLASLFDKNGNATAENVAANQSKADGYITAMQEAAKGLVDKVNAYVQPDFDNAVSGIRLYSKLYDPAKLKESAYTAESWRAYKAAYEAAQAALKKFPVFNAEMPGTVVDEITQAFRDFRNACHGLVETKSQITVTISLTDKYAVQKSTDSIATVTSRVTLTPGATVADALAKLGVSAPSDSRNFAEYCAYINGVQCYRIASAGLNGRIVSNPSTYVKLGLHDGDEVVIAKIYPKIYSNISELDMPCAPNMVVDYLKHQRITTSLTDNRVKAGESFTVTVTAANAMPSQRTGSYSPVSGAALYMGAASADQATAEKAPITTNLQVSTNASGQATVTLYESGWCLLYAYDLTENGAYTNGAATLIYVEPADDLAAIRAKLTDELTAIVKDANYPESYFLPEDWAAIQTAYTDALAAIQNAETSEAARAAQLAAMGTIRAKQTAADEYNVSNLASFRNYLNSLPEDLNKLDKSAESTIQYMVKRYEQMTGYQLSQLMQVEKTRYAAIKAAYDKGLKDAVQYQLKVEYDLSGVPAADRAGLQAMITWLKENTTRDGYNGGMIGNAQMAELFTFNNARATMYNVNYTQVTSATAGSSIYFCDNPAYAAFMHMKAGRTMDRDGKTITDAKATYPMMVDGNEYAIGNGVWQIEDMKAQGKTSASADGLRYTVNGHSYVLRDITYSGVTSEVRDWAFDVFDFSNYMGRNENGNTNYKALTILHSFKCITMPYDDVTVTITWAPEGGTEDELSAAREKAQAVLKAEFDKYKTSDKNYAAIKAAYDAGMAAINSAATLTAISEARADALSQIKLAASGGYIGAVIPNWGADSRFDAGDQVGTVTVSLANYTYQDGFFYRDEDQDPFLIKRNYPIGENDTMMTVILRALADDGYQWSGTGGYLGSGGSSKNGFDITYLAGISLTQNGQTYSLGEFGGESSESGWMGTLNDWFTNEGFSNFTVENGKLGDGDVISVQFTTNGLGADVGGTWNNSDTTLKSLGIEGGTLLTAFASGEPGGVYEYTLAIDSDAAEVKLTPTAANKNYLTKIFLNEKVTTDVEGASFYKRTQYIPVTSGDTLYVGCGEHAWPSMNKQGEEARDYTGTWYVLHVVNVSKGAGAVNDMINALPESVTYNNYQQYMSAVAAARASYEALSKEQQKLVDTAELEALEKAIADFQAIDDVKDKLDNLPNAGGLTIDDQEAVKAAQEAYDKLTDEQKEYLSGFQMDKMKKLASRMEEIIKENPTPTPTPGGNGGSKKPSQSTGKDVKSGNTGDAGITLYLGMGLVAVLAGAVIITRKRKEN